MAIKSNASVALKYPEGMRPSDGEKFRAIASASQQMTRLTEDLLFLARTERLPSHAMKPVEITALVHELHRLYEPEAIAKGLCLQVNCPKPLTIQGDEAQLHRLLTNLLTNALRYTQEGRVTLSAQRNNKGALVKVEDTGIGIPVDQIPKVFDRFWQASDVRQYNSEGFGLGLAIAQAIVRHHQGSLTVTSRVGVGSCFAVQLPVSRTTKVT
jgi:signal transduction histidine kinase